MRERRGADFTQRAGAEISPHSRMRSRTGLKSTPANRQGGKQLFIYIYFLSSTPGCSAQLLPPNLVDDGLSTLIAKHQELQPNDIEQDKIPMFPCSVALPTAADRTTRAPCLLPSQLNPLFVCKHSTPAMPAERLDVSEHRKARNRSRSPLVADPGLSSQILERASATNNNQNQNTVSGPANIVNSNPNFVIQSSSSAVVNYNSVSNFTTTGSVPEAFVSVSHDMILQY